MHRIYFIAPFCALFFFVQCDSKMTPTIAETPQEETTTQEEQVDSDLSEIESPTIEPIIDQQQTDETTPQVETETETETETQPEAAIEPTLLFSSGFEEGVFLETAYIGGGQWWQKLSGSDRGYQWSDDLPVRDDTKPIFQFLVGDTIKELGIFEEYVNNKIEIVLGHDGFKTNALKQTIIKDDPLKVATTRSQFLIRPRRDLKQVYVRFWMKYQDNLNDVMAFNTGPSKWRMITEWFELSGKYRVGVLIGTGYGQTKPHFYMLGQVLGEDGKFGPDWYYDNLEATVPAGKWFLFEMFWLLDPTDGKIVVHIDNKEVLCHKGRTQFISSINNWFMPKIYTGGPSLELGEAVLDDQGNPTGNYQWIDDFELWEYIPPEDASIPQDVITSACAS